MRMINIILPYFWIPEDNIDPGVRRDHVPYDIWERQDLIMTTEGNGSITGYIRRSSPLEKYNIREIAYDRWALFKWCRTLRVWDLR